MKTAHTWFEANLSPNRSLNPYAFRIVMIVLGGASFIIGLSFLLRGAWPVFGFLGLDVALVYWAFRVSYYRGRVLESVRLTRSGLHIEHKTPTGQIEKTTFQPATVVASPALDAKGHYILLKDRLTEVALARFLNADQQKEFIEKLNSALLDYRQVREPKTSSMV